MRISWRFILLLVIQVSLPVHSAFPEQINTDQAVQEALQKNLGLLAERYNLSIAEARIITARLRPNPVLSLGADYQDWLGAGFNPAKALGPAEVNLRTDFVLERGGKRERRIQSAVTARAVVQLQLLDATRTLILDVQNGCVEVLLAKESLALAQENIKAFNEIVNVNSARVNAGDLAKVELVRSQVAALQFQNAVLQAEARLRIARNRLQVLLGRSTPAPGFDVVGDLRREGQAWKLDELQQQALDLRPDLQALVKDQAR